MSFFNHTELEIIRELSEAVGELIHDNRRLRKKLKKCRNKNKRHTPILVLTTQNNIIMKTLLTLGTVSQANLILIDNVTLQPVSATFTGQTVGSDNPSAATFAFDPIDSTLVIATPVAPGTGSILLSTTATYVDSNTQQTITAVFSASYSFTVQAGSEGLTLSLTDFVPITGSTTTTSTTTV